MGAETEHFPERFRADAEMLAGLSPRLAQLASTHPLLFLTIASGYGPFALRLEAVRRTELGLPLRDVCEATGTPLALRCVRAEDLDFELCQASIPERTARRVAKLYVNEYERGRRARMIPALYLGTRLCDQTFGLWLSQQKIFIDVPVCERQLRGLALYAWLSRQEGLVPPALEKFAWSKYRCWDRSIDDAYTWYMLLAFEIHFGGRPIRNMWAKGADIDGLQIVPLDTSEVLIDEAIAMSNCLRTYALALLRDQCRLFGARRDGVRVGTIEVVLGAQGELSIRQFKGCRNRSVSPQDMEIAQAWIADQRKADRHDSLRRRDRSQYKAGLRKLLQRHIEHRQLPGSYWDGIDSVYPLTEKLNRHQWRLTEDAEPAYRLHRIAILEERAHEQN